MHLLHSIAHLIHQRNNLHICNQTATGHCCKHGYKNLVGGGVVYWLGCINRGLGQEVCEFLKGCLGVLSGFPKLGTQETVCLLQRIECRLQAK